MRIVVLSNWGLGLQVLKYLHYRSDVIIELVVTQYNGEARDRWYNVVYDFAVKHRYKVLVQELVTFDKLKDFIVTFNIDLLVCHGFMKILPKEVFSEIREY